MSTPRYEKLNSRFALIEYPVTLKEMDAIMLELPKTERKFYEITMKALKKAFKDDELIYGFEGCDPSLTKHGFLVLTQKEVILSLHKGAIMPSASLERIPMNKITGVDFDIIPLPINPFNVEEGSIILEVKKAFGTKKHTIRNVATYNLDGLVSRIRALVSEAN